MKQQIIRQFLKEGILLSPEMLEKITEENAEELLEQARGRKNLVLTQQEDRGLSLSVRGLQKKQSMAAQDFARYFNARFEGLRSILAKKLDSTVSVANAKKSLAPVAIIGMVRESTQRGFIIEDTTGEAEIISRSGEVQADDVIGVKGAAREGKLFAEEIVWPDVSLNHSRSKPDVKILLAEKDGRKTAGQMVVITPEAVFSPDKKRHALPNPGWISISKDSQTATVLVYSPGRPVTTKDAFVWLRKRHLSPSREQLRGTDDPFLIEPIPNLIWIVQPRKEGGKEQEDTDSHPASHSASRPELWSENYKGIMIVSSDGKAPAEVELATGEARFLE